MKTLLLTQENNKTIANITTVSEEQLPEGDITLRVSYSSLNYKDGLAITGKGNVIHQFPMVPGIDCAGTVIQSSDKRYEVGDKAIVTGWGVGEKHWGGMAEKARFKGDWLMPMPLGCDALKAMQIGTAGLTAMQCIIALEEGGVKPKEGPILVTGASGGVGSIAITLLAQLGYDVIALTGRKEQNAELLTDLGCTDIIERSEFDRDARPLEKQRWAGLIDTVGNRILATALAQLHYGGTAAICGLAGGYALPTTVMPFILRGIRLQGVDSVMLSQPQRKIAWQRVVQLLPAAYYQNACDIIPLEHVPDYANKIINGQLVGRVLVQL